MLFRVVFSIYNLTPVKVCKDKSVIFPAVSVRVFCDLNMRSIRIRLSLSFILYHGELYVAKPISLLYKDGNDREIFNVDMIFDDILHKIFFNYKKCYLLLIIYLLSIINNLR